MIKKAPLKFSGALKLIFIRNVFHNIFDVTL